MMHFLIDWFGNGFGNLHGWLFEAIVQPVVFLLGFGEYTEEAFEGTEWFMIGVCELALLFAILRPLEALWPVQKITDAGARWNDFIYTVIHRIGLFSVLIFFTLDPLMDYLTGLLRLDNIHPVNLETFWPDISPIASFMLYFVVLDFFDYWYHRASHQFNWWWGLHSLHHSQQNMNLWSDNRNHLLDDVLRDIYMALIALGIGVQPAQYMLLVSLSRILESVQHANIRLHFGRIGECLLVRHATIGCTTRSAPAQNRMASPAWAAAILRSCCRCGISCLARQISGPSLSQPACAISYRAPIGLASCCRAATTALVFGSNNGWACSGCSII